MTIFNDLGKTLNEVAAATADMLGDIAEATKVKTTIVREKNEMEELFAELGKAAYQERKDNLPEEGGDSVDALCRKLAEKEALIKDLEAKEAEFKAKEEAQKPEEEKEGAKEAEEVKPEEPEAEEAADAKDSEEEKTEE